MVLCKIYCVANNCSCMLYKYPIREASGGVTKVTMVLGKRFSKLLETLVWKGIFSAHVNCT